MPNVNKYEYYYEELLWNSIYWLRRVHLCNLNFLLFLHYQNWEKKKARINIYIDSRNKMIYRQLHGVPLLHEWLNFKPIKDFAKDLVLIYSLLIWNTKQTHIHRIKIWSILIFCMHCRKEMALTNTSRSSSLCWRSRTASCNSHDRASKLQISATSSEAHQITNWYGRSQFGGNQ